MENKRKTMRINAKVEVLFREVNNQLISSTRSKDISALGVCLPLTHYYPVGSTLEVEIRLDEFKEPIKAYAKVVRVIRKDDKKYPFEVGVDLLALSSDQKDMINDYIKHSSPKGSEQPDIHRLE